MKYFAIVLILAQSGTSKKGPTLDEALAWIKALPETSAVPADKYAKLTVDALKEMKEFRYGGHIKSGPHVATKGSEFKYLTALPKLEKLDLMENDGIDDEALSHIGKIKTLIELTIGGGGGQVTAAGLKHLENLKELTTLIMPGCCKPGDINAGLGSLAKLPKLEKLHLGNDKIVDAGLALLYKAPKLKELFLPMNPKVTPQAIAQLEKAIAGLKVSTK